MSTLRWCWWLHHLPWSFLPEAQLSFRPFLLIVGRTPVVKWSKFSPVTFQNVNYHMLWVTNNDKLLMLPNTQHCQHNTADCIMQLLCFLFQTNIIICMTSYVIGMRQPKGRLRSNFFLPTSWRPIFALSETLSKVLPHPTFALSTCVKLW